MCYKPKLKALGLVYSDKNFFVNGHTDNVFLSLRFWRYSSTALVVESDCAARYRMRWKLVRPHTAMCSDIVSRKRSFDF